MQKVCKLLALLMAILMLVTLSTACKKDDGTIDFGDVDEVGGVEAEGDEDEEDEVDSGDEKDDGKKEDKEDNKKEDNKKEDDKKEDNKKEDKEEEKAPTTQDELIQNYDETKKYSADSNPLVAEAKPLNTGIAPSFDLDTTGFVKNNIKLKDLKGKSFTLITAIMYDTFQYKDEKGKQVGEWEWWDALKKEYGLQIKYIKSRFDKSVSQALTYMNAGKALDAIPTHVGSFPVALQLTQPLDPYVNMQNLGNSPGVDVQILEMTKWGGGYRCISPIGAVNVLWYNQSMVEEFNLIDPHKTWQEGKWNWDTYASFLRSVPKTTSSGKKLYAYALCSGDAYYAYALANGCGPIEIDTKASEPKLINNWTDQRCLDAYNAYSSVLKSIQCGGNWGSMYQNGDVMMMDTLNLMNDFDNSEKELYCHTHKYNWVPYPKGTGKDGRDACFSYGYTLMLPKKMKNQSNAPYVVKFMELWANRFTEAIFDYQATTSYLSFDYAARKEYFEFVTKSTYFGLQMNQAFYQLDDAEEKQVWNAMTAHKPEKNMVTEMTKVANLVEKACKLAVEYGN